MTVREALDRRQEYMEGKITHQDYYQTIGECIGLREYDLPCTIEHVKIALSSGDEHLNTIPLHLWDRRHDYLLSNLKHCKGIGKVTWAISDTVCVLKATAKRLASLEV